MKRLLLVFTACALGWATGCGGGSSTIVPPPTSGFTNASLSGTYVFSMSGSTIDPNNDDAVDGFSRVGIFIADGKGDIQTTGGLEDQHQFGSDNIFGISGGSYEVNSNGTGTLSLITSAGTVQYNITLVSSTTGYMVDMISTGTETASGSFQLQTLTILPTGTYIFDFSGIAPASGDPISIVGDLIPDSGSGSGSFSAGSYEDINDNGTFVTKAQISGGSYMMDSSNPGTGRGTAIIGGLNYVFYVIDGQHAQFMETDPDLVTGGTNLGEAIAQTSPPNNVSAFSDNSFVFVIGGSSGVGPITRGVRLTATGGSLSAILLDEDSAGVETNLSLLSSGTVTLDGDNSGRGTITFTDNIKNTGTYSFVFYLNSATQGVIQDVSTVLSGGVQTAVDVADGSILAQTGAPFTSSSLAANYAFNWSGVNGNNDTEEDFVGSFATASTGNNGVVNYNEFGAGKQFLNVPFGGVIGIGGDGTASTGTQSTFIATLTGTPSVTINYFAFFANPDTILIMGTNSNRVIAGVLTAQTP